jgi:hypothetical protein
LCFKKKYKKTVVFGNAYINKENIKLLGLEGNGKPLSWNEDVV